MVSVTITSGRRTNLLNAQRVSATIIALASDIARDVPDVTVTARFGLNQRETMVLNTRSSHILACGDIEMF